jgi:DNA-binding NtrC family response regulator
METVIRRIRDSGALAKLIGKASAFVEVIQQIPPVAKSNASVLICGETGTGKELVARAIHYISDRAEYPFVAVNCGSLSDTLLEDELFGHERGAFTGAFSGRVGVLAQAQGGTLFLDEVDTLSAKAQIDLLRVLQEKKFRSLGSSRDQDANVRIVAAANAPFDALLQSGSFRIDLYYRLCVFSIRLPALRNRTEDIPELVAHFIEKHAPAEKAGLSVSGSAVDALLAWDWPGNIRELENAIIRGIHFSAGRSIEVADLRLPPIAAKANGSACTFQAGKRAVIERFEKDYLTRVLLEHSGNVTRAAAAAQKERREFGKLLKKHDLDPKIFRGLRPGC